MEALKAMALIIITIVVSGLAIKFIRDEGE